MGQQTAHFTQSCGVEPFVFVAGKNVVHEEIYEHDHIKCRAKAS
jgi:hypothetical protein